MAREYVPIFFDWLEMTADLRPREKGVLIDAIIAYASGALTEDEITAALSGMARVAFRFLKGQVDRNTELSEVRSRAGSRRKAPAQASDTKRYQTETNENKPLKNKTKAAEEKEKEYKEENEKEYNPGAGAEPSPARDKETFVPPTLAEVETFCQAEQLGIEPGEFHNYYTAKGWMIGNSPMKDWKSAVRNWAIRDRKYAQQNGTVSAYKCGSLYPCKLTATQYEQRDYTGVDEAILDAQRREIKKRLAQMQSSA